MLKIFYKENLNELLNEYAISNIEKELINDCKKVFNLEIDLLETRMDPYFTIGEVDLKNSDEYIEYNKLINETSIKYMNIIKEMNQKKEINYSFLDLLLYSSTSLYIHTTDCSTRINAVGSKVKTLKPI